MPRTLADPRTSRTARTARRIAGALVAFALTAAPLAALAASCPPKCLTTLSIKNAAGVDPKLFAQIEFAAGQPALASSPELITRIAEAWKATPRKGVLRISVMADDGLRGMPARTLASNRATVLKKALVDAGVPAAKLQVARR